MGGLDGRACPEVFILGGLKSDRQAMIRAGLRRGILNERVGSYARAQAGHA